MGNEILVNESEVWKEFHQENPLDFNFYDDFGNADIYIQNEDSPGRTHHLVILNKSDPATDQSLILQQPTSFIPDENNYHFELRFRPGSLVNDQVAWITIGNPAWRLKFKTHEGNANIPQGTVSLYFLYIENDPFEIAPRTSFMLPVQNVKAAVAGGSRGSRIELRYNLSTSPLNSDTPDDGLTQPTIITENRAGDPENDIPDTLHFRQDILNIINQRGIQQSPFIVALVNGSTILNDGTRVKSSTTQQEADLTTGTDNQLELKITNKSTEKSLSLCDISTESPTRFVLSFDTASDDEPWALGTPDQVAAIDVAVTMESVEGILWQIKKEVQGITPQWVISILEEVVLSPQEHFTLDLSGIKSSMPSGIANLYLQYENIPNYWDGEIIVPIEKSPMQFKDLITSAGDFTQNTIIGIGTLLTQEDQEELIQEQPDLKLIVDGSIKAKSIILAKAEAGSDPSAVTADKLNALKTLKVGEIELSENQEKDFNGFDKIDENEQTIPSGELKVDGDVQVDAAHVIESVTVNTVKVEEDPDHAGHLKVNGRLRDSTGFVIPPGGIIMWSGATVPDGWHLCDNSTFTNAEGQTVTTPDLRSRFIVGAGRGNGNDSRGERLTNYTLNSKGGKKQHQLSTSEMPSHSHSASTNETGAHTHSYKDRERKHTSDGGGPGLSDRARKSRNDHSRTTGSAGAHSHTVTVGSTGGSSPHENRPPYYVLAFIMKK